MPAIPRPMARGQKTLAQAADKVMNEGGPERQGPPLLPTPARGEPGQDTLRAMPAGAVQEHMRGPPDARESFQTPAFGAPPPGAPSFAGPPPQAPPMLPPQASPQAAAATPFALAPASRPRDFVPSPLSAKMAAGALPFGGFSGGAGANPAMVQQLLQALALRRRGAEAPGMGSPGFGAGSTPVPPAPGAAPGGPVF